MQQFGSQDWRAGRIREWLLLLLRFAITCDPKDQAAAFAVADELDALGHQWRPSAPSFFRRTSSEVCKMIIALDDPRRITILKKHIARIDDPRLRRAFQVRSVLSENPPLPIPRKTGEICGPVWKGNRSLLRRSPQRWAQAISVRVCATAQPDHAGRRASRVISGRDRACRYSNCPIRTPNA
jgi:hypothetical protein